MEKNKEMTALLTGSALVVALIAINNYKPQLERFAEQYRKNKQRKGVSYKKTTKRIITETVKEFGSPEKIVDKAIQHLKEKDKEKAMDKMISFLDGPFEVCALPDKHYNLFNSMLDSIEMFDIEECVSIVKDTLPKATATLIDNNQTTMETLPPLNVYEKKSEVTQNLFYKSMLGTMAIIFVLNAYQSEAISSNLTNALLTQETINSIREDMEIMKESFIDTTDIIVTLNDHEKLIDRKVERIITSEESFESKCESIYSLELLVEEEKIETILHLENIETTKKFDFFLNSGHYTLEDAIEIIITSNIASANVVFDYIMGIDALTINERVDYILHSDLTGYTRIFDYIMNSPRLGQTIKFEYIAKTDIALYDEKFDYIADKDLSLYDKIWFLLQIPNASFSEIFTDLLSLEEYKEEEVIQAVLETDLISFKNLFDEIIKIEGIEADRITHYLVYYTTYYNEDYQKLSLKEIIDYSLNIENFTHTDKVDCFWSLLELVPLKNKSDFLLDYYQLDINDYITLLFENEENLTEEEKIFLDLFDKVNTLRIDYVLETYQIENISQMCTAVAGIAAEGCEEYKDLYWVANTLFNRATHPYYSKKGINPYKQLISPGQFAVYISPTSGAYLKYLYPKKIAQAKKYELAKQAFLDMFVKGMDGIEHNYVEFRSWGTVSFSNNIAVKGGNRYGIELSEKNRVIPDSLKKEEVLVYKN